MRHAALAAGFAALYFISGNAWIALSGGDPAGTPVWPPTGFLLAALMILDCSVLPAPLLGAFAGSLLITREALPAAGIAAGNVAAACLAARLLKRFEADFYTPRGILLLALAGGVGAVVSATGSVLYYPNWLRWWGANALSVIIYVPFAIYWKYHPRLSWPPRRWMEFLLLALFAAFSLWGVFASPHNHPVGYMALPALLWTAVRFGLRETATLCVALSAFATWGTARALGPYPGSPLLAQAFVGIGSLVSLVLAAAAWQTKDAAERLRVSEERLRLAAQAADMGTWEWRPDSDTTTLDAAAARHFGFPEDVRDVARRDILERVHPEDRPAIDEGSRSVLEHGGAYVNEYRLARPEGGWRWVMIRALLRPDGGSGPRVIGIIADVTERRMAQSELERRVSERTAELQRANVELESFTHSLSHDLRASLRKVGVFSELALRDKDTALGPEGRRAFERIGGSVQRGLQIMDGLLRLSTINRAPFQPVEVDLSALAEDLAAGLKSRYPACFVEFRAQPGLKARADPRLIREALAHLLDNAWKFTCETAGAKVEFGRDEEGRYFVRDNGPGFEMPFSDRIFGAFERLHSVEQAPGVGVGLALVKKLVERHGGRVWAEARVDRGATFYFTLGGS